MKNLLILLIALSSLACMTGQNGEQKLNTALLHAEFQAFDQDAAQFLLMIPPDDASLAKTREVVEKIQASVAVLDRAVTTSGDIDSFLDALDVALKALPDAMSIVNADPELQLKTRLIVWGAGSLLRHARAIATGAKASAEPSPSASSGAVDGSKDGPAMVAAGRGRLLPAFL
jgi:hypothetical protein